LRITSKRRQVSIDGTRVEMARTPDGVVELWAEDDVALACGLGYAHAHDRTVQIMLVRLAGQGRLSECLQSDEETLAIDIFARGMGLRRDAERDVANLTPETLRVAEAYASGVNHYLERHRRPLELVLVGYRPEPWTVADTLIHVKLITYVGLAQTQQDFEKLLVEAIRGGVSVPKLKRLVAPHLDGLDEATVERIHDLRWMEPVMPPEVRFATPTLKASNNWAVAGSRTATGSPLVCFDPHLEVNRLPAVWYETIMHTPDDYRLGITMPGVPGVVMGRTRHLSFGFTYGFMDMSDFFIEECRDGRCRRGDGWSDLDVRTEEILRRGSEPLSITVRESSHGVVEADPLLEDLPDGLYLARAWSNHIAAASPSLEVMHQIPTVRTVPGAQRLLRKVTISCNWVLADSAGNIGFQQSGRLPDRRHSGMYPVPGWDEDLAWNGYVDPERLHTILNPDDGFLATANDDLNPPDGPLVINLPMGSYRADRIRATLGSLDRATLEDMKRLQVDLYSLHAERFMQLLRPLVPDDPAAELLLSWDLRYDRDSRGASLFEDIYQALLRRVFGDGMFGADAWDALATSTTTLSDYYHLFDDALLGGDPTWFDGRSRKEVFAEVLQEVLTDLDPAEVPTWGARQQVVMANIIFGGRLPRWLGFDRGPIALEGNRATVVQGAAFSAHGRLTSFGPSWRFASDMASDEALTILPGGPSGRRFSRWYVTDVQQWLNGEYKTLVAERQSSGIRNQ
jgi:penicillin amidase